MLKRQKIYNKKKKAGQQLTEQEEIILQNYLGQKEQNNEGHNLNQDNR